MNNKGIILLSVLLYFGGGVISVFFNKGFSMYKSKYLYFEHPFFITLLMFTGEYLCYIPYKLSKTIAVKSNLPPISKIKFALPAFFDMFSTNMSIFSLMFLAASVSQMLSGSMMIVVCILSIIYLKKRYIFHHWIGLGLVIAGLAIVATSTIIQSKSNPTASLTTTTAFGVILYLLSQIFAAIQVVIEESYFRNYSFHMMECVFYEGLSGITFYVILLPILQFIPCKPIVMDAAFHRICALGVEENSVTAIAQIGANTMLLILVCIYPINALILNTSAQGITKYMSGLTRSILLQCRTGLVWVVTIIIGWETFIWGELIGFIVLVIGALIYNDVIRLPCCREKSIKENSQ